MSYTHESRALAALQEDTANAVASWLFCAQRNQSCDETPEHEMCPWFTDFTCTAIANMDSYSASDLAAALFSVAQRITQLEQENERMAKTEDLWREEARHATTNRDYWRDRCENAEQENELMAQAIHGWAERVAELLDFIDADAADFVREALAEWEARR